MPKSADVSRVQRKGRETRLGEGGRGKGGGLPIVHARKLWLSFAWISIYSFFVLTLSPYLAFISYCFFRLICFVFFLLCVQVFFCASFFFLSDKYLCSFPFSRPILLFLPPPAPFLSPPLLLLPPFLFSFLLPPFHPPLPSFIPIPVSPVVLE